MGRQPYITRLALGRSPYEPPESSSVSQSHTSSGRNYSSNTDGYVQQYDDRGHPIFPESKALARDLRRAKNDVLSTMGVVVSGEAGRSGVLKDKKSVKDITAENDYGLVIVAFDHVLHFFGSWWIGSLGRRIQTFKNYTHIPLIRLFRSECQRIGWSRELFAGMPLWAARVALPICRTQLLEPLIGLVQNKLLSRLDDSYARLVQKGFSIIRLSTRIVSFMFFEQIHMFCILQTLHLIPHSIFLRPSMLLPFTRFSLIQSPSLPSDFSLTSLGRFGSELAATPFAFAFAYVLIRPIIEDRVYRIIRRHLPKQERPDEVSIQVAMDNDLLEWTLPTAGRRTEDEVRRSNLSLFEDIKEEFRVLQRKLSRWLGYNHEDLSDDKMSDCLSHNDIDTIRETIIQDTTVTNHTDDTPIALSDAVSRPHLEASIIPSQALTNGRFTHSPSEISPASLDETHPMERAETNELLQPEMPRNTWLPFQDYDQDSRSDTLFSRPASPESPLASPRIRASLTHQNSFTTTMELSLQSSRNPNTDGNLDPITENELGDTALADWPIPLAQPDFSTSELVTNQVDQNIPNEFTGQPAAAVTDIGRSNVMNQTENDLIWEVLNGNTVLGDMAEPAILPHVVEEPMHSPMNQAGMDQLSEAGSEQSARRQSRPLPLRSRSQNRTDSYKQRITVLSSYPADALAHHLASLISGILFIPFESFFYRSLARAYLSSQTALLYSATSPMSTSDIRGLDAFAGGGSRQDMFAYMRKLSIILGIQTGVSGAILGVCSATAIGIGKRFFDWGKL